MESVLQVMRRMSGRASEPEPASPGSAREAKHQQAWGDVFDPNTNPRMKNVGRSYYDSPDPGQPQKGVWDYHLDAQKAASKDMAEGAFRAMGASGTDDALDASQLRKMFDADRVQKIMEAADKNKDGRISYKEFCDMLRKYPCD
ncbi:hypothetical protein ABPG77_006379 [Micractinium sp. CCAP 211/92]